MVSRKLKNEAVSVKKEGNSYVIQRPDLKGLVLSGGGARGLAYVGMYKALHETRDLDKLTNVAGASAGAMTASLMALGTSPSDFEKISTQIDMEKLIDMSLTKGRSDGSRFRNVLQLIYFLQFQERMKLVDKAKLTGVQAKYHEKLAEKLDSYIEALKDFKPNGVPISNITELLDFIKSDANVTENFEALGDALQSVHEFTFKDLTLLRNVLPKEQQHIIKDLSVAATNKTERKQIVYSCNETPNYSLATAVMQSGAHPLMFRAQRGENDQVISDGGVLDNMPSEILERLGLDKQEILCVKVNEARQVAGQLRRASSAKVEKPSISNTIFDAMFSSTLGGKHKAMSMQTREREKVFYDMGNMLFLNSGDITATTTHLTDEQRKLAIDNGYDKTLNMVNDREMRFTNRIEALLYVGEDELKELVHNLNREDSPSLFDAAVIAYVIFNLQNQIAEALKESPVPPERRENIRASLVELQTVIQENSGLAPMEQLTTQALCLKQINFATEGKLSQFLNDDIVQNPKMGNWAIKLLMLIATPFKWLVDLCSKKQADYQNVNEHDLDNSHHAKEAKSLLDSDERLFDREPSNEPREALSEAPDDFAPEDTTPRLR